MQDINSVNMVGRLTRDAELKYTNTGYSILNFSIASNRGVKKNDEWQDEVSFFNCVLFGKRAEALAQYMTKGKMIVITGELTQDRWTDQNGQNRSVVKIIVNKLQFVGGKPGQKTVQAPAADPDPDLAPLPEDDFTDEIPF